MRISTKGVVRRLLVSAAVVAAVAGGVMAVTESPAMAAGTSCKTLHVGAYPWQAIQPWMDVPICYNGSSVWQSGPITPGVSTYGYVLGDTSWYGSYGSGGWLGVGENYHVTVYGGWASFSCASRWGVNALGNVISYDRGC
jgi:hypothetical protein